MRPKASGIERMIYAVTYRCNSRCKMCNIWKKDHSDASELNLDMLHSTFLNNRFFDNLIEIGLTGGEPFLRDDLHQIGRFFLKNFPQARISVNSNGLMPDLISKTTSLLVDGIPLDERQRIRLSFSLDGIGEKHDLIRGRAHNFEKVLQIVEKMKNEIPGLEYGFTFTVLPENYDQIWDVYNLAKDLKVGFSFSFAQTSGIFYENKDLNFSYTPVILEEAYRQIRNIQKIDLNYTNYYYDKIVEYQNDPCKHVSCYAGHSSFFLDPYGNVYPCILHHKAFGNIKQQAIQDLFNSNKAKAILDEIKRMKCHCWGCESEVSFRRSWKVALWSIGNRLKNVHNLWPR